jgi:hypothetical protein
MREFVRWSIERPPVEERLEAGVRRRKSVR